MSEQAPHDAAAMAAARAIRTHGAQLVETLDVVLPHAIAAAIDAYERQRPYAQVRLLRPEPGDSVVFHVEHLTVQEFDEFSQALQPLRDHHPGVLFLVAERVDEITVTRPLSAQGGQADG